MNHLISITKVDGTKELFEESKLIDSLKRAGGSEDIVTRIVERVESDMKDGMTTTDIYRHAFDLLREHSAPVATRYSLRRALEELGPDGFPFEKFVAEIFKAWKFETLTDQIVPGVCVEHEIDVVAWNPDKLIMVEAKFHNEFGLKSDLKVALYVKARFDDLRGTTFNYGIEKDSTAAQKGRHLDEGWLVTNTKFTDQAIKYGVCNNIKMVGWNYPPKGNLHDIIEENHLHPFTCLATLSNVDKKNLRAAGAVLCKNITPELLLSVGFHQEKIDMVMKEIEQVCG